MKSAVLAFVVAFATIGLLTADERSYGFRLALDKKRTVTFADSHGTRWREMWLRCGGNLPQCEYQIHHAGGRGVRRNPGEISDYDIGLTVIDERTVLLRCLRRSCAFRVEPDDDLASQFTLTGDETAKVAVPVRIEVAWTGPFDRR